MRRCIPEKAQGGEKPTFGWSASTVQQGQHSTGSGYGTGHLKVRRYGARRGHNLAWQNEADGDCAAGDATPPGSIEAHAFRQWPLNEVEKKLEQFRQDILDEMFAPPKKQRNSHSDTVHRGIGFG